MLKQYMSLANSFVRNLASQLSGEVTVSQAARRYFATDGSVFTIMPEMVVYPKNETDVVNVVKYLNWKAQAGEVVNLTARGKGTDQGGGALGNGVMLVFPAHMKNFVGSKNDTVAVEPGINYGSLQQLLKSHGRYLPPYPASIDFSTIGGAVANNAAGEKTIKYGSTRDWVAGLRVVLSNGDIIATQRLDKKQLKKKQAQQDFEGHIYRELDKIIMGNWPLLKQRRLDVSKNSAGYDLWDVKRGDGSFDLGQLMVGSQGTLGVITQVTLRTMEYNRHTTLLMAQFDDLVRAEEAVAKILPLQPSAAEMVDYHTLEFIKQNRPEMLHGIDAEHLPKLIVLIEFDDAKPKQQSRKAKQAYGILKNFTDTVRGSNKPEEQAELWRIRRSAAAVVWSNDDPKKALPIIEDGVVAVAKLSQYLNGAYKLFDKYKVKIASWGHAGNANMHMQPFLNLSNMRDRAKLFELSDDYYKMVIKLGGSTCAEHNDGIMRGPYLKALYGAQVYKLFEEVKQLFDPHDFLNNQVKMGVTREDAMVRLRREYSMRHLHDHLPNTNH